MPAAEDGLPTPQRSWAVLTLAVGLVLSVLDSTIANIALPAIARELDAGSADSIWVINAHQSRSSAACFRWLRSATSSATAASTRWGSSCSRSPDC